MSFSFVQSGGVLRYEEGGSAGLRVTATIAGLLAIAFSWVFVDIAMSMGDLSTPAKIGGLLASIASIIVFLGFGAYCLKLALFTPRQVVTIDSERRRLVLTAESPARGRRESVHAFEELSTIDIGEQRSDEGPTTFTILIGTGAKSRLEMGVFDDRAQARAALRQVADALGRPV